MNILYVITGLGLGGAEKQVCLLADKFSALGHNVSIVALTGSEIIRPENNLVSIHLLKMKKTPIGFLVALCHLKKIIKEFSPDIIHGHMFHANILTRLVKMFSSNSYRLICTAHSKNEGGKLRMLTYRITDKLSDINTNVSQEALDAFISNFAFSKKKSFVVYNGIDIEKFTFAKKQRDAKRLDLNIKCSDKLLLSVGRLTPAKDYPNLLDAFLLLPDDFKLAIIGDGELREQLATKIHNSGLDSRVILLGEISDVYDYYPAGDLYILSSKWEGFGLVVAEAMACERVAICTDAGGVREVIGNGKYVVPVSDPKALSDKIIEISQLSECKKYLIGKENRQHVIDNFSISMIIKRWHEFYTTHQVSK